MKSLQIPDVDWQIAHNRWLNQHILASFVEARGPKKFPSDVLATVVWCEEVKSRLQAFTAHRAEEALASKDRERHVTNKWHKYETGRHRPSPRVVSETDRYLPGTARLFHHPLWLILRMQPFDESELTRWLRGLSPQVQLVCFGKRERSGDKRKTVGHGQLRQLERQGTLDALACITALLREALWFENDKLTWEIAESLFRMLLMTLTRCLILPISDLLWSIYRDKLFTQVHSKGLGYCFDDFDMLMASQDLVGLMLAFEDRGIFKGAGERKEATEMQALLNGDYGFGPTFLFAPPISPSEPRCLANEKDYLRHERRIRFRHWAGTMMQSGKWEHFPPAEIW